MDAVAHQCAEVVEVDSPVAEHVEEQEVDSALVDVVDSLPVELEAVVSRGEEHQEDVVPQEEGFRKDITLRAQGKKGVLVQESVYNTQSCRRGLASAIHTIETKEWKWVSLMPYIWDGKTALSRLILSANPRAIRPLPRIHRTMLRSLPESVPFPKRLRFTRKCIKARRMEYIQPELAPLIRRSWN